MTALAEDARRQDAWLALWSVPGVGVRALEGLAETFGTLEALLELPPGEWLAQAPFLLPAAVKALGSGPSLVERSAQVKAAAARTGVGIAYRGGPQYPARMVGVDGAPPVLFFRGPGAPVESALAMVGSRRPEPGFTEWARRFTAEVARAGVCVVSGAAEGVDRVCHLGALDARAPTWAFLGCAIDQADPAQTSLLPHLLDGGGTVYSEFPPGVRANRSTFPRRNRLISGAADAVLVLRAGRDSGALHTARYALEQGRPVLALPGDARLSEAEGCNRLIRDGQARAALSPQDVLEALAWTPVRAPPAVSNDVVEEDLTDAARRALASLQQMPMEFDALVSRSALSSGALASALCELELMGLVVQHPGRRYGKV